MIFIFKTAEILTKEHIEHVIGIVKNNFDCKTLVVDANLELDILDEETKQVVYRSKI